MFKVMKTMKLKLKTLICHICETEYSDIEDFESKAQPWKVFPQQK